MNNSISLDSTIGEELCKKCLGTGIIKTLFESTNKNSEGSSYKLRCEYCLGTGKLDWIENIVGKKKPKPNKNNIYDLLSSSSLGNSLFGEGFIEGLAGFNKSYHCDFINESGNIIEKIYDKL